jgi:AraC-like DNA-binding protein
MNMSNIVRTPPPLPELPMVREQGCGCRVTSAASSFGPHRNRGIELCRIRAGLYRWQVEGRTSSLGPGDGFVTLPWQEHGGEGGVMHRGTLDFIVIGLERCTPGGRWAFGAWCGLDAEARRLVERTLLGLASPVIPATTALGGVFDRYWEEIRRRQPGWIGQCHALLGELLLTAARRIAATAEAAPEDDAPVQAALRTIGGRIGEPWTLADMADLAGLGRTRFGERLQAITGLSPRRWLLRQRLEAAAGALRAERPVTAIAIDLGFASSQHFATAFRREFGLSPVAWRRRAHSSGGGPENR